MKCKNCGSNLEIENAYCPYCGRENPFAKKHRDDMKKYASDYNSTKDEVISRSRNVNTKAVKAAVIALTVAAFIALLFYLGISESLKREHSRNVVKKDARQYIDEVIAYANEDDYLAVDELARTYNMLSSLYMDGDYFNIFSATSAYADMFVTILNIREDNGYHAERYARYLSSDIYTINYRLNDVDRIPDEFKQYAEDLKRDTYLLLKTYLGYDEDKVNELINLADSKRINDIWETIDEINEKK